LEVALSKNNLAWIYFRQAQYQKAQKLYEEALSIREQCLGDDSAEVARSTSLVCEVYTLTFVTGLHELAELHHKLGQYNKAEAYNKRALDIRRKGNSLKESIA
jgi:tetratricopeptide (TPR) repeat protein